MPPWYRGDMKEDQDTVVAFTIRMPYAEHQALRRIAFHHEGSINGIIGGLISEYLEEHANGCIACD